MAKKVYYQQNNGHLPTRPPHYLGTLASACWRKIYRNAYDDIRQNGIQAKIFSSLQDSSGKIVGKDFVGFRKNPAVATMKDAVNQLNSIGVQLGLTPKGRQELMQIASHKKEKSMTEQLKEAGLV